jgi:hypothetical protein
MAAEVVAEAATWVAAAVGDAMRAAAEAAVMVVAATAVMAAIAAAPAAVARASFLAAAAAAAGVVEVIGAGLTACGPGVLITGAISPGTRSAGCRSMRRSAWA